MPELISTTVKHWSLKMVCVISPDRSLISPDRSFASLLSVLTFSQTRNAAVFASATRCPTSQKPTSILTSTV